MPDLNERLDRATSLIADAASALTIEFGEELSVDLQKSMDQHSRLFEELSNLMRMLAATDQVIVGNIKG